MDDDGKTIKPLCDNDEHEETIFLKPFDSEKKFEIRKKAAILSKFINVSLSGNDPDDKVVEIPHVKENTLEKIIEYLNHVHEFGASEITKPVLSDNLLDSKVTEWDNKFIDVKDDELSDLLCVSNFMDIEPLLHLCCAKYASLMKNKTIDEIRKTFNIKAEYTQEEEERTLKEYGDLLY